MYVGLNVCTVACKLSENINLLHAIINVFQRHDIVQICCNFHISSHKIICKTEYESLIFLHIVEYKIDIDLLIFSAYLALNHINRGDQTTISEEVQNHLEDLLQKVQDFEHTCMEKELLTAEKIAQLETEVDKKVVEFQSQLHRILK